MTPWGVWMRPTRAADLEDRCTSSNRKKGAGRYGGNELAGGRGERTEPPVARGERRGDGLVRPPRGERSPVPAAPARGSDASRGAADAAAEDDRRARASPRQPAGTKRRGRAVHRAAARAHRALGLGPAVRWVERCTRAVLRAWGKLTVCRLVAR